MKKLVSLLLICFLFFLLFLLFNTYNFKSNQLTVKAVSKTHISPEATNRFIEAVSIKTISFSDTEDFDSTQFQKFNIFLEDQYPIIHKNLEHKTLSDFSHLYEWSGENATLDPIVLVAHIDVVPIASLPAWSVHPFTEGIKEDTVYGRGTLDDKVSLISIMEAVEQLLKEGFKPQRTIYLAFGHDEELLGHHGALKIAKHLSEKGVKAHFVLDEGSGITKGMIPGLDQKTALIGIAEKGFITLELSVNLAGGHSSMPASETSIDVLAAAVSKLKQNPFPTKLTPTLGGFIKKLGPEMDFTTRLAMSNLFLFKSTILKQYEKTNAGNANIRTTISPTIFEAGIKSNVIPTSARALINFRILPGETNEDVFAYVKQIINDDRITIEQNGVNSDPSPVSPISGTAYNVIEHSIKEIFPDVLTSPSLVIAATDARHFAALSPNIYRFLPIHISPKNINCFHGIDEHIAVKDFENSIRFYRQIIINGSK